MLRVTIMLLSVALLCCCSSPAGQAPDQAADAPAVSYAIAIHGGAGTIERDTPLYKVQRYERSLERALRVGQKILDAGGSALDAVETVVLVMEDDPLFNAGRGAVYTAEGSHELDASIMDGRTLAAGGAGGLTTVRNPIVLARLVMEETRHVLLAGFGAERFARDQGVEIVEPTYFDTEARYESWLEWREGESTPDGAAIKGTAGAVALDRYGNLAAATSTGGLTGKMVGRIGDTPIVGAGTYADNAGAAVSCTGTGEQFIRHMVAAAVSKLVEREGLSLEQAASVLLHEELDPGDGGLIAVGPAGEIVTMFTTEAMLRGAADSTGRFEIDIW
jgi:beta-aspartyl-peptidase (threonine type)